MRWIRVRADADGWMAAAVTEAPQETETVTAAALSLQPQAPPTGPAHFLQFSHLKSA